MALTSFAFSFAPAKSSLVSTFFMPFQVPIPFVDFVFCLFCEIPGSHYLVIKHSVKTGLESPPEIALFATSSDLLQVLGPSGREIL